LRCLFDFVYVSSITPRKSSLVFLIKDFSFWKSVKIVPPDPHILEIDLKNVGFSVASSFPTRISHSFGGDPQAPPGDPLVGC